jgi:hypothetical protein
MLGGWLVDLACILFKQHFNLQSFHTQVLLLQHNVLRCMMGTCRYANALEKANYASLALKETPPAEDDEADGDKEEDDELAEMLARTRRAAQAKEAAASQQLLSVDAIAEEAARRRAAEEAQRAAEGAEGEC